MPRFAVSILFQEQHPDRMSNMMRMKIVEAGSVDEAIGKTLLYFREYDCMIRNASSSIELAIKIQENEH